MGVSFLKHLGRSGPEPLVSKNVGSRPLPRIYFLNAVGAGECDTPVEMLQRVAGRQYRQWRRKPRWRWEPGTTALAPIGVTSGSAEGAAGGAAGYAAAAAAAAPVAMASAAGSAVVAVGK
jgi:hypothetical protein